MDNELLRLILFLAAIGVVNDPPQLQTRMPNHVYVAVRPAGGCQRIQGTVQGQQWFVLSDGIADPVFDNSVDCALVPAASLPPAHRKRPPGAPCADCCQGQRRACASLSERNGQKQIGRRLHKKPVAFPRCAVQWLSYGEVLQRASAIVAGRCADARKMPAGGSVVSSHPGGRWDVKQV